MDISQSINSSNCSDKIEKKDEFFENDNLLNSKYLNSSDDMYQTNRNKYNKNYNKFNKINCQYSNYIPNYSNNNNITMSNNLQSNTINSSNMNPNINNFIPKNNNNYSHYQYYQYTQYNNYTNLNTYPNNLNNKLNSNNINNNMNLNFNSYKYHNHYAKKKFMNSDDNYINNNKSSIITSDNNIINNTLFHENNSIIKLKDEIKVNTSTIIKKVEYPKYIMIGLLLAQKGLVMRNMSIEHNIHINRDPQNRLAILFIGEKELIEIAEKKIDEMIEKFKKQIVIIRVNRDLIKTLLNKDSRDGVQNLRETYKSVFIDLDGDTLRFHSENKKELNIVVEKIKKMKLNFKKESNNFNLNKNYTMLNNKPYSMSDSQLNFFKPMYERDETLTGDDIMLSESNFHYSPYQDVNDNLLNSSIISDFIPGEKNNFFYKPFSNNEKSFQHFNYINSEEKSQDTKITDNMLLQMFNENPSLTNLDPQNKNSNDIIINDSKNFINSSNYNSLCLKNSVNYSSVTTSNTTHYSLTSTVSSSENEDFYFNQFNKNNIYSSSSNSNIFDIDLKENYPWMLSNSSVSVFTSDSLTGFTSNSNSSLNGTLDTINTSGEDNNLPNSFMEYFFRDHTSIEKL